MASPELLQLEKEADALRQQGLWSEAIEVLERALANDESFVRAHLALAVLYHRVNDPERACSHAERACELEPSDSFNFTALSVTYQRAFEATGDPAYIHKAEMAMARSRGM